MIRRLTIDGFRGFQHYEVSNLGRVNLLVGTNNCGKTTVLEAVHLMASVGDSTALFDTCARRGERSPASEEFLNELEVQHLFNGHEPQLGSALKIRADTYRFPESFTATIVDRSRKQQPQLFQKAVFDDENNFGSEGSGDANEFGMADLALELDWAADDRRPQYIQLTNRLSVEPNRHRRPLRPRLVEKHTPDVRFITTAGLAIHDVVRLFENIVLSKEEQFVIEALSTIEPRIERLATVSGDSRYSDPGDRGGIVVRLSGTGQRVPIGSMGDGIWRMLGLALVIASAKGGIVLIDEIDTGLHFTVMEKMWRLVYEAASRLDVQVFATTHSRDAYESLAAIARPGVSEESDVTIQRIDSSGTSAVTFTEQEIIASAEHNTEVR